jgi:hypothetical protein
MPKPENRLSPDHAPTPFSAAELRTGCGAGRRFVVEMWRPGHEVVFQGTEFVDADEEGATMRAWNQDETGKRLSQVITRRVTWRELQKHASFESLRTRIDEQELVTPAGRFDCWRYTVTGSAGESSSVDRLWFAKDVPGMPVLFEQEIDGERVVRIRMIENRMPGESASTTRE